VRGRRAASLRPVLSPQRLPHHAAPLRERHDDIPLLARHFVAQCGRRLGRRIARIDDRVWDQLQAHDWPGNVRELQNVIERAIILTHDDVLRCDAIRLDPVGQIAAQPPGTAGPPDMVQPPQQTDAPARRARVSDRRSLTFSDAERLAIIDALRRARGRVSGPAGAAALLGLKPTTLHAKMKKRGISREDAWRS